MSWDESVISAPILVPILGEPATNPEGEIITPIIGYIDGYHVNCAPSIAIGLASFAITPRNPTEVFTGTETVFLRFENEIEARENLKQYWNNI